MTHRPILRRALCCVLLIALATPSNGFDTGHHKDMTVAALQKNGFSQDAIDVVVLQNWLVDWYSGHTAEKPTELRNFESDIDDLRLYSLANRRELPFQVFTNRDDWSTANETGFLHFDNLYKEKPRLHEITTVTEYWHALAESTASELHQRLNSGVKDPDVLGVLSLLGISLHAVQDFYSHSTWFGLPTRQDNGSDYDVTTWWDVETSGPNGTRLRSVVTGAYPPDGVKGTSELTHNQLNKDGYDVVRWDRAYAGAYWASLQWIEGFHLMVEKERPGYWESCVKNAKVQGDTRRTLTSDLIASRLISETTHKWKGAAEDIHYTEMATSINLGIKFDREPSVFKDALSKRYVEAGLTRDLGHTDIKRGLINGAPTPVFPHIPVDQDAVLLVIQDIGSLNDNLTDTRLHAEVHMSAGVSTQEFIEDTAFKTLGSQAFGGKILFFVPKDQDIVYVKVSLYNSIGSSHNEDQHLRINHDALDLSFTFNRSSGMCILSNGDHPVQCNEAGHLRTSGESVGDGSIDLYLESRKLTQPPIQP